MKKVISSALLLVVLLALLCGCQKVDPNGDKLAKDGTLTAVFGGEQIQFSPWEQEGLPSSGSYYLTKPVQLSEAAQITGDLKLYLNGNDITVAEDKNFNNMLVVSQGVTLTLYGKGENPGSIIADRSIMADLSTISTIVLSNAKLVLEGACIDASGIALEDMGNGMAVHGKAGSELIMNSGTIIGGYTERTEQSPVRYGMGGSVYLGEGSYFEMNGGEIRDGSASRGGNVYINSSKENPSKMLMTGGTIRGGETTDHGGNIWLDNYCAFAMLNGTICEGVALQNWRLADTYTNGANIRFSGANLIFVMVDGKIIDGETWNYGTNISNYGSTLHILGGELNEGTYHNTARSDSQGIWCYGGEVSDNREEAAALLKEHFDITLE